MVFSLFVGLLGLVLECVCVRGWCVVDCLFGGGVFSLVCSFFFVVVVGLVFEVFGFVIW